MGRPIRIQFKDEIIHVTNRFLDGLFLAAPNEDSTIHDDFEAILEAAIQAYGLILYVGILMSNHFHLCLKAPNGNLSRALRYIQTELAKAINRDRGRTGTVFPVRFKHTVIGRDEEAQVDILRYIILNPVSSHLVRNPHQWPGFITSSAWLDCPEARLSITPMPCFASMDEQHMVLRQVLLDRMAQIARRRRRFLGARAVRATPWNSGPAQPLVNQPRCYEDLFKSQDPVEKKRLVDKSRQIEDAWRQASVLWKAAMGPRAKADGFPGLVWVFGGFPDF